MGNEVRTQNEKETEIEKGGKETERAIALKTQRDCGMSETVVHLGEIKTLRNLVPLSIQGRHKTKAQTVKQVVAKMWIHTCCAHH